MCFQALRQPIATSRRVERWKPAVQSLLLLSARFSQLIGCGRSITTCALEVELLCSRQGAVGFQDTNGFRDQQMHTPSVPPSPCLLHQQADALPTGKAKLVCTLAAIVAEETPGSCLAKHTSAHRVGAAKESEIAHDTNSASWQGRKTSHIAIPVLCFPLGSVSSLMGVG